MKRIIIMCALAVISFSAFDDLFEYMKSIHISARSIIGGYEYSVLLNNINHFGSEFWKHIDRFKTQYEDMIMWTELALSPDGNMMIQGF